MAECAAQEHLDGDVAIEIVIVCLPHFAHAAFADQLEKAVSPKGRPGLEDFRGAGIKSHEAKLAALSW